MSYLLTKCHKTLDFYVFWNAELIAIIVGVTGGARMVSTGCPKETSSQVLLTNSKLAANTIGARRWFNITFSIMHQQSFLLEYHFRA